jgi:Kef-type K+ transport system membrane component KefB
VRPAARAQHLVYRELSLLAGAARAGCCQDVPGRRSGEHLLRGGNLAGHALLASVVSIKIAIPAALVEIVIGALAGNIPGIREHVTQTDVVTFLASVGSLVLTFLAGAEIDPVSLRGHWKASLSIGLVSFAVPFAAAFGFCGLVLGWHLHAAEIGGIALSTTSVAVVYGVMVETGLNRHDLGKLILAACFITDLGTVLTLGGLFASFG